MCCYLIVWLQVAFQFIVTEPRAMWKLESNNWTNIYLWFAKCLKRKIPSDHLTSEQCLLLNKFGNLYATIFFLQTLDELPVDADAVERGYSLNPDPTGLPRIHGLPSSSFYSTSSGSTESYTASPKNPRSRKSSHSGELYSSHITADSNGGGRNSFLGLYPTVEIWTFSECHRLSQ